MRRWVLLRLWPQPASEPAPAAVPCAFDDDDELQLHFPASVWRSNLCAWRQAMDAQRSAAGCSTDELDSSDIEEDAEALYSFAHAEADAFPRAWDDAHHAL